MAHSTVRNRFNLPRRAQQLASAYEISRNSRGWPTPRFSVDAALDTKHWGYTGFTLQIRCSASGCIKTIRQTHWNSIGVARAISSPIFPLRLVKTRPSLSVVFQPEMGVFHRIAHAGSPGKWSGLDRRRPPLTSQVMWLRRSAV